MRHHHAQGQSSARHTRAAPLDHFHRPHIELFHHLHDLAWAIGCGMVAGFLLLLYLRLSRLRFTWALLGALPLRRLAARLASRAGDRGGEPRRLRPRRQVAHRRHRARRRGGAAGARSGGASLLGTLAGAEPRAKGSRRRR